jgi:hypothetical protein
MLILNVDIIPYVMCCCVEYGKWHSVWILFAVWNLAKDEDTDEFSELQCLLA